MIVLYPNNLDFKKATGTEKIRCPNCDESRSDKKDKSLIYSHEEQRGKCFYCEALVFPKVDYKTDYILPEQNTETNYSAKIVEYCLKRGITESTLRRFYVTEEKYYQPKEGKEVNNICFNYFEWEKLVNKKYRSGAKSFTQVAKAKSIFYNLNATIGEEEVIIVEGEFDVLAMYQAGVKNVISVPNGANNNDDYWNNSKTWLKDIKSFIIAVDNDDKGNTLKENIAQRLGRHRCKTVIWSGKDANDELLNGDITQRLKEAKRFPVSGVLTVDDLYDEMLELYDNGLPKTIKPLQKRWAEVNEIFSVMFGQLTVVTGIPSHGKSSVIDDYILSLANDLNFKCSWFSPEHNPKGLHQVGFAKKVLGRPFWGSERIERSEIDDYRKWAHERIYITSQDDNEPTWNWLFEKMEEQIYSFGIQIFCIDAFNKVIMESGDKTEIDRVLSRITSFCVRHNVMIFLVVHPTKMRKKENGEYEVPSLYDCSGSADFRNQTHNGISIYRTFEDENNKGKTLFINAKTKFDFQGKINGIAHLQYCKNNSRFYTGSEPLDSFLDKKETITESKKVTKEDIDIAYNKIEGNGVIDFELAYQHPDPEATVNDAPF